MRVCAFNVQNPCLECFLDRDPGNRLGEDYPVLLLPVHDVVVIARIELVFFDLAGDLLLDAMA